MNIPYLLQKALILTLYISAPLIVVTIVLGIVIGIVQSVMQLQEQSLPFGIKLVATVMILALLGHWMGGQLLGFLVEIMDQLPYIGQDRS